MEPPWDVAMEICSNYPHMTKMASRPGAGRIRTWTRTRTCLIKSGQGHETDKIRSWTRTWTRICLINSGLGPGSKMDKIRSRTSTKSGLVMDKIRTWTWNQTHHRYNPDPDSIDKIRTRTLNNKIRTQTGNE